MLVVESEKQSIISESYKKLRTNIQYSSVSKEIKTILITSSDEKEGKSTISANLGLSFSQNDKSVLILDCDLRKPIINKLFNISNSIGITDIIIGEAKLEDAIKEYSTNLSIITSGKVPPNPSEILGSQKMKDLLKFLKSKYDVILIDSPPVGVVTDAQILSTEVDGTIVIVKSENTKSGRMKECIKDLKNVNANIIGVVMNFTNESNKKYKKYYTKQ